MIKFFGNIRKTLLSDGKTGHYLKYAVGEIILVMVGILLALSINNWNEDRHERQAELKFYGNIKEQLLDDAANISSQIRFNTYYNDQFKYARDIIEVNDRTKMDTLARITVNLSNYSDFDRQGNIYETMVNSGDIKLLKNEELIDRLRRLEETYIYINRMETIHFEAILTGILPNTLSLIKLTSYEVKVPEKLYGFEVQNFMVVSMGIMDEKADTYNRAMNEINAIISLIDSELETRS